jgi:hypothetical protein
VVTINCATWLAPLLRAALLARVLGTQLQGQQSNASPERLQASVWARTYRDISLKKAQMLHETLRADLEGELHHVMRDVLLLRTGRPLGSGFVRSLVAAAAALAVCLVVRDIRQFISPLTGR